MLARRRAQRAYRVYAENDFLAADDAPVEDAMPGDSQFGDAPSYTAAPRSGMPGPLGGRVGVVIIALVAMAVSALVVHALRAGLGGGRETPFPATTAPVATAAGRPAHGRASAHSGIRVQGAVPRASSRARSAAFPGRGEAMNALSRRAGRGPLREETDDVSAGSDRLAERGVGVVARASEIAGVGVPSADSTATPEFGFER
jgi:hypothetical protein